MSLPWQPTPIPRLRLRCSAAAVVGRTPSRCRRSRMTTRMRRCRPACASRTRPATCAPSPTRSKATSSTTLFPRAHSSSTRRATCAASPNTRASILPRRPSTTWRSTTRSAARRSSGPTPARSKSEAASTPSTITALCAPPRASGMRLALG